MAIGKFYQYVTLLTDELARIGSALHIVLR
jgi:hypothetical protein